MHIRHDDNDDVKGPARAGGGVRPAGFEPATDGLENRCSIRLSYGRDEIGRVMGPSSPGIVVPTRVWSNKWMYARQDSNLRPAV